MASTIHNPYVISSKPWSMAHPNPPYHVYPIANPPSPPCLLYLQSISYPPNHPPSPTTPTSSRPRCLNASSHISPYGTISDAVLRGNNVCKIFGKSTIRVEIECSLSDWICYLRTIDWRPRMRRRDSHGTCIVEFMYIGTLSSEGNPTVLREG